MNAEDRVATLLREALDHPEEGDRERFLASACAGDDNLRRRLDRLLATMNAGVPLVDQDVWPLAGRLLHEEADLRAGPEAPRVGERIGPFEVTGFLGRGGMGEVLAARRSGQGFTQDVAIKRVHGMLGNADALARFARERGILAGLHHPGIARFIDGGVDADGRPWFAMERVDGRSITDWADSARLDVRGRVGLLVELCDAVQAAHARLIVHGDIKPGNVLVDATGRPRLLDFGIAGLVEEAGSAQGGLSPHTPDYAAPEQRLGEPVTTATDVYGLGALLHRLLVGRPPDRSGSTRPIASSDGRTARTGGRGEPPARYGALAGDLGRVVSRCLAPEPAGRYQTAEALADDLRRWLARRPVRATPPSVLHAAMLLVARQPLATLAAGLALLVLAAAFVFSQMQAARASQAARAAAAANDFLASLFAAADPAQTRGERLSLREVLDAGADRLLRSFENDPATRASLATVLAASYVGLGRADLARPLLLTVLPSLPQGTPEHGRALLSLAQAERLLEDFPATERHARAGLALLDPGAGELAEPLATARNILAYAVAKQGRHDEAIELYRGTLARLAPSTGAWLRVDTRNDMATVATMRGDWSAALTELELIADALADPPPERLRDALMMRMNLAVARFRTGASDAGAGELEAIAGAYRELLGPDGAEELAARTLLGQVHWHQGDIQACADTFGALLAVRAATLGDDHPLTLDAHASGGRCLAVSGRDAEARSALDALLAAAERHDAPSRASFRQRVSAGFLADDLGMEALPESLSDEGLATLGEQLNLAGSDDDLRRIVLAAARQHRRGDSGAAAELLSRTSAGGVRREGQDRVARRVFAYRACLLRAAGRASEADAVIAQVRADGGGADARLTTLLDALPERGRAQVPQCRPFLYGLG
ncbi:MAG: serine/threonine protein kinase [Xanthomonadales bacterium]|nr:serine/threonine protein kinase [Xanthomonadales bacterium]